MNREINFQGSSTRGRVRWFNISRCSSESCGSRVSPPFSLYSFPCFVSSTGSFAFNFRLVSSCDNQSIVKTKFNFIRDLSRSIRLLPLLLIAIRIIVNLRPPRRGDDLSTNTRRMPFDWNTNFGINANDLAVVPLNWIRQTDGLLGSSMSRDDATDDPSLHLANLPFFEPSLLRAFHSIVSPEKQASFFFEIF